MESIIFMHPRYQRIAIFIVILVGLVSLSMFIGAVDPEDAHPFT